MIANQQWLDVIANNLSNVNTHAFKRDAVQFNDWMERSLVSNGGSGHTIGSLGAGPAAHKMWTVMGVGTIETTDNPLDVAITTDNGMFAVGRTNDRGQMEIFYTRDGQFRIMDDGRLVNMQGLSVLDYERNAIYVDTTKPVAIDDVGNVGPIAGGEDGEAGFARIGLWDGTFSKYGGNLYSARDATLSEVGRLQSRSLEGSNVNVVETMIQMVNVSKAFEMAQRAITSQDESSGKLLEVLKS